MDACSSYIICSTQRSGSTLLCDGLISTGVAGRPAEYFNVGPGDTDHQQPPWKDDLRTKPLAEYLPVALRHGTTENGVFGLKLHWIQLQMLERNLVAMQGGNASLAERLARAFPQPRYIWMTRRDKVRQAVSLFKAKQSHSWHSIVPGRSSAPPVYSFHLIEAAQRQIIQEEAAWAGFFDEAGIVPHTVVYEDLVMAYEETIHGVLEYLEIPLPEGVVIPAPRLRKLADDLSEQWVRRYSVQERRRHRRRLLAGLPVTLFNESLRATYLAPQLRRTRGMTVDVLKRILHTPHR